MSSNKIKIAWIAGTLAVVILGYLFVDRILQNGNGDTAAKSEKRPIPVEVAAVQHGPLTLYRTFSGTIDPQAQFTVAPKVSGRIQQLLVDVSDPVKRGQLVAQLEDAEFKQAVAESEARLAVAEANRIEAESRMEIAQRELDRAKTLHKRGIASDSAFDSAQAEFLASQAAVKVAEANVKREDASLEAARIRMGYTQVQADWKKGDDERTVAERYADEGNTVAANTPLFSIVEIDPVIAVIHVTEKDYPRIAIGHQAKVVTDAFPGRTFTGTVSRIAPIFRESSRQARVEIKVANPEHLLKPGMFARCTLELERLEETTSVPEMAITRRNNKTGVFLVAEDGASVKWVEVETGLYAEGRVQLAGSELFGQVVTLGQQFIKDGSSVRVAGESSFQKGGSDSP